MTRAKLSAYILLVMLLPTTLSAASVYESKAEFLQRAFSDSIPEPDIIWLSGERKLAIRKILDHDYAALRVRYWCQGKRSAWVLDEIGKDLPITVGVIVESNYIKSLKVLTYRENRGGEVATPAFTDQFRQSALAKDHTLDTRIDGITGATLSVRALTRLATMALFLHTNSACKNGA